jgi:hypothetical protein
MLTLLRQVDANVRLEVPLVVENLSGFKSFLSSEGYKTGSYGLSSLLRIDS